MSNILDVYSKLKFGNSQISPNFIGRGNIWINNTYEPAVIRLARYIIHQAMLNTAPGQLSVLGYDSDLSGVFAPFSALSAGESKQMEFILDEKEFHTRLDYISEASGIIVAIKQPEAALRF